MLKNSILHIISSFGAALLNFVILLLTAKILGAEGRGEITYLLFYCSFIQIFTAIVGSSMMIYMLTKLEENSVLVISFIWTFLTVITLSPFLYFFDDFIQTRFILFLSITILQSLFSNLIALFSAKILIKKLVLIRLTQPLLLIIFLGFSHDISASSFLNILTFSYLPALVYICWLTFGINFQYNFQKFKTSFLFFIKLGSLNQLNHLMQFGCYRYAIWIIADQSNLSNVGVFGLWITLVDALWLIPISIATINQTYSAKNNSKNINMNLCYISALVSVILIAVTLLIPLNIYELFLGKDFNQIKHLLLLSSPAVVLFTFNLMLAYYFSAKGKIIYNTISSGLGFIIIIIISPFLINKYGLNGAVITNSISYVVTTITTLYLYFRYTNQLNNSLVSF